jgi:hypothetical protein
MIFSHCRRNLKRLLSEGKLISTVYNWFISVICIFAMNRIFLQGNPKLIDNYFKKIQSHSCLIHWSREHES